MYGNFLYLLKIKPVKERVDDSNWIILTNIFIEPFRKQASLQSAVFFDEAGHERAQFTGDMASYLTSEFHENN